MKDKKNIRLKYRSYVFIAVCIAVVAGTWAWYFYLRPENQPQEQQSALEIRIQQELSMAKFNNTRPDYGIPKEMFQDLPKFPTDFYERSLMYRYGLIQNEVMINESYWKQPEWFTGWVERVLPLIKEYSPEYINVICTGTYPAKKGIEIRNVPPEGAEFDSYMWLQNGNMVERKIGIYLIPVYPNDAMLEPDPRYGMRGMEVSQDAEQVKRWIQFTIEPNILVLEPSFPIYRYGYRERIKVHVKLSGDIPKGKYVIGFDTVPPPNECNEDFMGITGEECNYKDDDNDGMIDETVTEQWVYDYGLKYNDGNLGMTCSPRIHRLFIEVM